MTGLVQRWFWRRDSYRPPDETIATHLYEVAAIPDDATARSFVEAHHYSGSYPAARRRFGLYRLDRLVGVAVFSHPVNDRTIGLAFPGMASLDGMELGRFVLLDEVPANGETWFLGRCYDLLRQEGVLGVIAFSDPVPRDTLDGRLVLPGHIGTIYQAHNGRYLGRSTPRSLILLPDGRVLSSRSIQKLRSGERGGAGVVASLVSHGAARPTGNLGEWLAEWTDPGRGICRRLRHIGNHRYAWPIQRGRTILIAPALPYPKTGMITTDKERVRL